MATHTHTPKYSDAQLRAMAQHALRSETQDPISWAQLTMRLMLSQQIGGKTIVQNLRRLAQ